METRLETASPPRETKAEAGSVTDAAEVTAYDALLVDVETKVT